MPGETTSRPSLAGGSRSGSAALVVRAPVMLKRSVIGGREVEEESLGLGHAVSEPALLIRHAFGIVGVLPAVVNVRVPRTELIGYKSHRLPLGRHDLSSVFHALLKRDLVQECRVARLPGEEELDERGLAGLARDVVRMGHANRDGQAVFGELLWRKLQLEPAAAVGRVRCLARPGGPRFGIDTRQHAIDDYRGARAPASWFRRRRPGHPARSSCLAWRRHRARRRARTHAASPIQSPITRNRFHLPDFSVLTVES